VGQSQALTFAPGLVKSIKKPQIPAKKFLSYTALAQLLGYNELFKNEFFHK